LHAGQSASREIFGANPPKKSPSRCGLGLNPPKEEGGGDKLVGGAGSLNLLINNRTRYRPNLTGAYCALQEICCTTVEEGLENTTPESYSFFILYINNLNLNLATTQPQHPSLLSRRLLDY
jgi:hypothetical protein